MSKTKPRVRAPRHRLWIDLPPDVDRALRLRAAAETAPRHRVTPATLIVEACRRFVVPAGH